MDASPMYSAIQNFPQDLQEAIKAISQQTLNYMPHASIQHVVITGMGSSGLAGTLVKQLVNDKLNVPVTVNQDYTLPTYVNEHTLLIVVSYSGNTQETLAAFQLGLQRKAHIIAITSGGALQSQASQHPIDTLLLPIGFPPRAAIAYTLTQVLFTLSAYKLFKWDFIAEMKSTIQLLNDEQLQIQVEAQQVAHAIQDNIPVIYTTIPYEHVAIRLRQQLNENSKQLCWHQVIPEFNHNEIVGWESKYTNLMVIMLSGEVKDESIQLQEKISQDILKKHTDQLQVVKAQGSTHFIRSMYLLHLGDWISFYVAQNKAVDPTAIQSIDQVKAALYEQC